MAVFTNLIRYLIAICSLIPLYSLSFLLGFVNKPLAWRFILCWDNLFLRLFGVEVEFEDGGISHSSGGVVIGLRQLSLLDPIIGRSVAPVVFNSVWNIEYTLIPFIGWITIHFGWVIVRQWSKQAKRQLEKAVSYIRDGGFVYVSIEGKRTKDGSISPYKKGPVVMAIQAQSEILPVIVNGSRSCLPYGEWKIRPGKVTIKFLEPISTKGMSYEDRDLLVDKLRKLAEKF